MVMVSVANLELSEEHPTPFGGFLLEGELPSDAELEALALGAAPDDPLPDEVPPLRLGTDDALLPSWYMPAAIARYRGGWRVRVIAGLIIAFLLIEIAGLCFTYGPIV
jgi:hypothetical protein